MHKCTYDTAEYPFREIVEEYMDTQNLEELHISDKFEKQLTSSQGDYGDQKQQLHRRFYNRMDEDPSFIDLYKSFVKDVVSDLFEEELYYQEFPTFRIHQPDNICVFDWHRDMDFGHSPHEINIFMPITEAYGNNTIWAETEEGKKDYMPMNTEYGEIVVWNGAKLTHGNKNNDTGQTRVSFDFRVLEKSKFNEDQVEKSLTQGVSFSPGSYFASLS